MIAAARPRSSACLRVGPRLDDAVMREVRRVMELRHHKWDAQVGDVTTLAPFPLLMDRTTWSELSSFAEQLFGETTLIERELGARPSLHATVAVPRTLRRLLAGGTPSPAAARIMRFDFHPTGDGWRVSEVNSDVPGGFTEATNLALLMARHVPGARLTGDPTRALVEALARIVGDGGSVALTNAPGHMEDHQVVAHLAEALRRRGLTAWTTSLGQLDWRHGRAHVRDRPISAIFRFYQAEWLARLPPSLPWRSLFVAGRTPVVNPLSAVLSESKRAPLVWDRLGVALPTWRRLLPETRALADAPWRRDDGWLIKSAYSNTGDDVCVREAMPASEWRRRSWTARLNPGRWLAQRRFDVTPLLSDEGPLHPCIGVYVVDGKAAGAYARVTPGAIIDYRARDAAVLISEDL